MFPNTPADVALLHAINVDMQNPVFDAVMPTLTSVKDFWLPLYVLLFVVLLARGLYGTIHRRDTTYLFVFGALLCVAVGLDHLSNSLLKEPIGRLRPYETFAWVHQLVGSGGGSFPSNHALNNTAAAVVLSIFFPTWRALWWSIAVTIAFSRVYVGVHYPSDVLAGMVIGGLAGWGVASVAHIGIRRTSSPYRTETTI